ncbi:MAG: Mbeg1-like protein [Raoultibacter sp.]
MQTIIDYLESEFAPFEEKPFNALDSLVLSSFCMVDLAHIAPPLREGKSFRDTNTLLQSLFPLNTKDITFREVPHAEYFDTMFTSPTPDMTKRLMFALAASPRFRAVTIGEYLSLLDTKNYTQFAAMRFIYKRQFAYIAFRGTDCTLTGWREDFDMAFTDTIPSQIQSINYLETVTPRLPQKLYIGGHSKGGNLAVYAALKAQPETKARIERIYNHDGPGFKPGTFTDEAYDGIRDRIFKTVPQESLVGMLMESHEDYRVIHSNGAGIMQHDPFTWEAAGDDFVYLDRITDNARFTSEVINEWMGSLSPEELRVMTDTLFATLAQSEDASVADIMGDWRKILALVVDVAKQADDSTTGILSKAVQSLSNIALKRFGEGVASTMASPHIGALLPRQLRPNPQPGFKPESERP